jgi:hypothetical protein
MLVFFSKVFIQVQKCLFLFAPISIVVIFGLQKYRDIILSKHSPLAKYCQLMHNFESKQRFLNERRHFFSPKIAENDDHNIDPRSFRIERQYHNTSLLSVFIRRQNFSVIGRRDMAAIPVKSFGEKFIFCITSESKLSDSYLEIDLCFCRDEKSLTPSPRSESPLCV